MKVSFLLNTLLGPGGRGLLPPLPCVRLHKACRATLRPVSPQRKLKIETGPFWTRTVPDSGRVAGSHETHLPQWFRTGSDSGGNSIVTATWASSPPCADRLVLLRVPGLYFHVPQLRCLVGNAYRQLLSFLSSFIPDDSVEKFFTNRNLMLELFSTKYKLALAQKTH